MGMRRIRLMVMTMLYLLVQYHCGAQCSPIPLCEQIIAGSSVMLPDNDLSESVSQLEMGQSEICYTSNDLIDISNYGLEGVGIVTWLSYTVSETSEALFVRVRSPRNEVLPLVNVYLGSDCDFQEVFSTRFDQSPAVLATELPFNELSYNVRVVVPIADSTNYSGSFVIEGFTTQQIDPCNFNIDFDFNGGFGVLFVDIPERTLSWPGEPLLAGEQAMLWGFLEVMPDDVAGKAIIPMLGDGWEYIDDDWQTAWSSLAPELDVVPPNSPCPLRAGIDMPFYCTYTVDGLLRLCNMAVQDCPCSAAVAAGDDLPAGFTVPPGQECNSALGCSPSGFQAAEELPPFIEFEVPLGVSADPFRRDFSLSFLIMDEGTTGCAPVSCHSYIPPVALGEETKANTEQPLYRISTVDDFVCGEQPIEVDVAILNSEYDRLWLQVRDLGTVLEQIELHVEADTIYSTIIPGYATFSGQLELLLTSDTTDFGATVAWQSVFVEPPLEVSLFLEGLCSDECVELVVTTNIPLPQGTTITWSDGNQQGAFREYCKESGPISLYVDAGFCGSDTVHFSIDTIPPQITVTGPEYICAPFSNLADTISVSLLEGNLDDYFISIASPDPVFLTYFGRSAFLIELSGPTELEVIRYQFIIFDQFGCEYQTPFYEIDNYFGLQRGPILLCKDGEMGTTTGAEILYRDSILAQLPADVVVDFDYTSDSLVVSMDADGNFVIDEEASDAGIHDLTVNMVTNEGCNFEIRYTYVIRQMEEIEVDLTDFEADFSIPNASIIQSIMWDFGDGNQSSDFFPTHIYSMTGTYTVTATIEDLCGTYETTQTIFVGGTHTSSEVPETFRLYPNPSSGTITIAGESIEVLSLHGVDGSQVALPTYVKVDEAVTLDISSYPAGIYIIKLRDVDGNVACRKLIKVD